VINPYCNIYVHDMPNNKKWERQLSVQLGARRDEQTRCIECQGVEVYLQRNPEYSWWSARQHRKRPDAFWRFSTIVEVILVSGDVSTLVHVTSQILRWLWSQKFVAVPVSEIEDQLPRPGLK
jgi:hypothetical protein